MPPRRQPGRKPSQNLTGGIANSGLGLLGAAPAELQQGYGGGGGGAGMGQNTQMGMGARPLMGGASQYKGNSGQMGIGDQAQRGRGKPNLRGSNKPGNAGAAMRGRGRKEHRPNTNFQSRPLLPDPTSQQTDRGYGTEQQYPGDVDPSTFHKRPQPARGRRAAPGNAPTYTHETENYGEEQYHDTWPSAGNGGKGLLGEAPQYAEEAHGYQEGQYAEQWPPADKRKPLLGETLQYDETQGYQEEYADTWPQADQRKSLLGEGPQNADYADSQGYHEDQHARPLPPSDRRRKPILEAPTYDETQGYYGEERAETWFQTEQNRKSLLGEAPQGYQEEAYNEQWPHTEKGRKPPLRKTPQYKEKPQDYQEGYQEGYGDTRPPADKRREPFSRKTRYKEEPQDYQKEYSDAWPSAGNKKKSLLGEGPQYETERYQDAQYADSWPVPDNRKEILGAETWSDNKRGLLGEAPGYAEDAQAYGGDQYAKPQPPAAKRRALLGEAPPYVEETQEYREGQFAEDRPGILGDAPAAAYQEGANEYKEQYDETWPDTRKGLLGDVHSHSEAAHGYGGEPYAEKWPESENKKGLLGDAPPYMEEGKKHGEDRYAEAWPQSDSKKGLLGDAPGYEAEAHTGGYPCRRAAQGRPGAEDEYGANYPEKKASAGMGGMMKGGMQQRSEMGMDHMGMRNQIGVRGDREMGMDNRMRPPSQSGSDQYRMGDRDNRRSSAGSSMGLLGSGPDQGRGYGDQYSDRRGYGDQFSDRQSDNYMERSSAQQPRSLLGPRPLIDDNRVSDRERALAERERLLAEQERVLALQAEERRLLLQREEQLRIQQGQQLRMQREEQMREEQLRAEQMRAMQILQQEQQRKRPMQSQQRRMGKSDGLLGEAPASVKPIGAGQGGIPSLFDLPGGNRLGKRPGDRVNRPGDKRPRREPSPDRRRGQNRPDSRRDQQNKGQQDRSSGQSKPRSDQSPASQKKDHGESGARRSTGSRQDNRKDSKAKDNKKETTTKDKKDVKTDDDAKDAKTVKPDAKTGRTVNTKITVTIEGDSGADKYDPANPTAEESEDMGTADELKMNEEELEKMIEKDDNDDDVVILGEEKMDTDGDKDGKLNESNLTVTVTKNKKGRSVNDADGKPKAEEKKTPYHCNVCNVSCFSEKSFSNHLTGQKHQKMMQSVMTATEKRSQEIAARLQAESHIKKIEGQSKKPTDRKGPAEKGSPGKALESHCRTCDRKFTGAYKDHKETPEHKDRESLRRAGCKICSIPSFSNYNIYCAHLESDLHKKNAYPQCNICKQWFKSPRKFVQHCKTDHHIENKIRHRGGEDDDTINADELSELVTLDVIGFDDETSEGNEETIVSQGEKSKSATMTLEPLTPMLSKAQATSTPKLPGKFGFSEEIKVPEKHDPDSPVGQDYVIPVSGYFCKLCHKFYNNLQAAKTTHCQSKPHFDKYKNAMIVKAAKQSKEQATGSEVKEVKVTESKNNDQSENTTKTPDQSAITPDQSAITEASNYETADEQQDSTIQKTTESSQEIVENTEKQLVNGNTSKMSQEEVSKEAATIDDDNADSQEEETGTVDLMGDDNDNDDVVVEVKGKGRGTPTTRGGAPRNKARRAKRI